MQFLFKRSQVASYNALLCRCHEVTQGLIQLSNKLQVKYGHWEINDAVKNAAQSSTGLDSPLLDEAKSCSEEDLRLTINQISWQLNNVIQYTTLAIHQLFYLQKKEDKLQSTFQLMDDQAQYYQKTLEVQAPTVDEKTIAEHQIKVVQQIASIEGILSDPHSPAITMMSQNPYAYVNVLTDALKNMRACRYEASVLYASDKKLIFDINTIVDDLGMLVEQIHTTITLVTSLRPEWIDYLQRNGIDVNSAYPFDPKLIELVEAFLKEKTPYGKTQLLADEILKIIRSDEFKERLNFSNIRVIRPPNNLNKCGAAKWIRFFLVSRNRRNTLWAKHSSPVLRQKRMPQTRASFCISSLNFTSLLVLIRILLFPFLQLLLSLFAGVAFLNFGHEKAGEGINDGLRQFNLVWIQTFFLAGHGVLPRQQTPSGST